jgi:hypothetical protein
VDELVFERVDFFLQFSSDLIGHDCLKPDCRNSSDYRT